jgi:hypothetical protein
MRDDFGEDMLFADPAGDEPVVLGAEIEDEDPVQLARPHGFYLPGPGVSGGSDSRRTAQAPDARP